MKQKLAKFALALVTLVLLCAISLPALAAASPSPTETPAPSPKPTPPDRSTNVNVVISGSILKMDDVNVHKITLDHPAKVSLTFSHVYLDSIFTYWKVGLYDSDDALILDLESSGKETTKSTYNAYLPRGTYFVKVTSSSWSNTKYGVMVNYTRNDGQFEIEQNGAPETASKLTVNKEIVGNIVSRDDEDCYKFTIGKPGKVSVTFAHSNLNSIFKYWIVGLYDADDMLLAEMDVTGNETKKTTLDTFLCAGDYYIKVWGGSWSFVDYKLLANYELNDGKYEIEPNNSEEDATLIQAGKPVMGNLNNNKDSDWYTFKITKEQKVSLTFAHKNLNSSMSYYTVRLYDADGEKKSEIRCTGNETKKATPAVLLPAGNYYAEVLPDWYNSQNYTLTLNVK